VRSQTATTVLTTAPLAGHDRVVAGPVGQGEDNARRRVSNADDVVDTSRRRSAWAVAGVGLRNAGVFTVRHVEERDRQDGVHGAGVDDVLLVIGLFEEDLPGGEFMDAAFAAANRLAEDSEFTRVDDQHCRARVGVPAREPAGPEWPVRG